MTRKEAVYKELLDDERERCLEMTKAYKKEHDLNKQLLALYQDCLLSISCLQAVIAKENAENAFIRKVA